MPIPRALYEHLDGPPPIDWPYIQQKSGKQQSLSDLRHRLASAKELVNTEDRIAMVGPTQRPCSKARGPGSFSDDASDKGDMIRELDALL